MNSALRRGDISTRLPDTRRAFAPKTRAGMCFRDLVIKAFAIPGLARLAVGRDIADVLQLPSYGWPSLDQVTAA